MVLFLLEVIGITGLIGMFPPLRGMLVITGFVAVLLLVYLGLVVRMNATTQRVDRDDDDGDHQVLVLPEVGPAEEPRERPLVRLAR